MEITQHQTQQATEAKTEDTKLRRRRRHRGGRTEGEANPSEEQHRRRQQQQQEVAQTRNEERGFTSENSKLRRRPGSLNRNCEASDLEIERRGNKAGTNQKETEEEEAEDRSDRGL